VNLAVLKSAKIFSGYMDVIYRNEVSQHDEVRVWIPDGRSYRDENSTVI
jgi:hypothetical protein